MIIKELNELVAMYMVRHFDCTITISDGILPHTKNVTIPSTDFLIRRMENCVFVENKETCDIISLSINDFKCIELI